MNKSILPPWFAAIAIITYRGAKSGNGVNNPVPHFALPADYVGAFFVFGILSLMSGELEKVAQVTAWGLDVAILLNLWNPNGTVKTIPAQAKTTTTAKAATK